MYDIYWSTSGLKLLYQIIILILYIYRERVRGNKFLVVDKYGNALLV